jgi:hypothetical protein
MVDLNQADGYWMLLNSLLIVGYSQADKYLWMPYALIVLDIVAIGWIISRYNKASTFYGSLAVNVLLLALIIKSRPVTFVWQRQKNGIWVNTQHSNQPTQGHTSAEAQSWFNKSCPNINVAATLDRLYASGKQKSVVSYEWCENGIRVMRTSMVTAIGDSLHGQVISTVAIV